MVHELRGVPCIGLVDMAPDRKSIMATRSFGRGVTDRAEMEQVVTNHVARAAEKMRRQQLATASLIVFTHTNRHKPGDWQYYGARPVQQPVATADTGRLTAAAMHAVARLWRQGFRYAKAGVMFPTLTPASQVQGTLFAMPDSPERQRLMRALDALNGRYGRGTLVYGMAAGKRSGWKLRSEHLSPRFTTSWDELLGVRSAADSQFPLGPKPVRSKPRQSSLSADMLPADVPTRLRRTPCETD